MGPIRERWHRSDWLAVLAIVLSLAASAPVIAHAVEPQPLVYRNLPFPVLNAPVISGGPIVMLVSRCGGATVERPYVVSRELLRVDGRIKLPLPPTRSMGRAGCEEYRAQTASLPDDVEPGIYIYRGVVTVPGWFRDHAIAWETEPFEIVESGQ